MSPRKISKIHARTCQAFANATRIEIIEALIAGETTTEQLALSLGVGAPNISQHLNLLRDRGFVISERRGRQTFHHLSNDKIVRLFLLEREILSEFLESAAKSVRSDRIGVS